MAEIYWTETAREQLFSSIASVERYFTDHQAFEQSARQIEKLLVEMNAKIELLKGNPRLYPVRLDFDFYGKEYRSFIVHWFTFFYRYSEQNDTVQILYIRPSKSDFGSISSL